MTSSSQPPRKLLDQLRDCLRVQHYSTRTEQSYVEWARRYILFHQKRHPKDMGAPEVKAFLTHLALERMVAASTQNQALSALLQLYLAQHKGATAQALFKHAVDLFESLDLPQDIEQTQLTWQTTNRALNLAEYSRDLPCTSDLAAENFEKWKRGVGAFMLCLK
jgi:hypothetical protein